MQIYSDTTNLFEYCAHEYERYKLMVAAALVHKCVEVTYMKVAYFKHSNASKDQHELKKSPRKKAKITLNRPNFMRWLNYERQTAKEPSSPCAFRLSSEGLPLLLPYVTKQILSATLTDFHHLLQYRVVKFQDFVDAGLGDRASKLMAGCCVIVLNEKVDLKFIDAIGGFLPMKLIVKGELATVDLISKAVNLFSLLVDMVIIPATTGHMGVLPGHVATIAELKPGVLSVHEGNDVSKYFISSGFAFIHANSYADIVAVERLFLWTH